MELDDLKAAWKKMDADQESVDERSIKHMISQQSKSVLGKIRQNMFLDIVAGAFAVIVALATIIYARHSSLSLPGFILLSVLIVGWIGFAYPRLYRNSKESDPSGNVINNLHQKITALEKDLQFYKNLNVYMYPLAVVVGLVLDQKVLEAFRSQLSDNYVSLLLVLIAFVVIFPLYVLFVKWWANFMYGRFIDRLRKMYQELITEETEE